MSALILTVKTDNTGTSNNDQFTLPLKPKRRYDFIISGNFTNSPINHTSDSDLTLTFPSGAGTYDIEITGKFPAIYFNNRGDKLKLLMVKQWGTNEWKTFEGAFYGCSNLAMTTAVLKQLSSETTSKRRYNWKIKNAK